MPDNRNLVEIFFALERALLSPSFFAKLKNILTHLKGTIKQCGKYQICEFTERRNNGQVQIQSQCKQKRSCKIEAKHNKTQCKKNGQKDRKLPYFKNSTDELRQRSVGFFDMSSMLPQRVDFHSGAWNARNWILPAHDV